VIPDLDGNGNLPPGIHETTWDEFATRYGTSARRQDLLAGLRSALESLRDAGCRRAYVNGSFVTNKPEPGDFDACWETDGVDPDLLDPVLLDFADARRHQKEEYGGELFPADVAADAWGTRFLDFFQQDRNTGAPKGIVALDLTELE
jgi:hypothetical protein